MTEKYKLIPFDLAKAKTPENPKGLEVVTRDNRKVRIIDTHRRGECPIISYVETITNDGLLKDDVLSYYLDGKYLAHNSHCDLFLKEPIKLRRMTAEELSKWLREKPEEFREAKINGRIGGTLTYLESDASKEANENTYIRSNYGEWREPLVEEE